MMGDLLVFDSFLIYRDINLSFLYFINRTTMLGEYGFMKSGNYIVYDIYGMDPGSKVYSILTCTSNSSISNNYC